MTQLPPKLKMATNFAKAVVKHVVDRFRKVTLEQYQKRIDTCNSCEWRDGKRCTHPDCGCFIDIKAWWESEDCPICKWPKIDDDSN